MATTPTPSAPPVRREDLADLGRELRQAGRRIVSTNGCFDLLHVGHVRFLQQARALGDVLVVGLNDDASVRRLKGEGRPLTPEAERAEIVASLAAVDYVTLFGEELPNAFLAALRPHIHVKGADYTEEECPEAAVVRQYGGEMRFLPLTDDLSTTGIVERIIAQSREGPRK